MRMQPGLQPPVQENMLWLTMSRLERLILFERHCTQVKQAEG